MEKIIIKPVLTEKSLTLASRGWYTFAVTVPSSKNAVAHAIEVLYKVNVMDVRTITMHGKTRRSGKKMVQSKLPNWKKAMVLLKEGQSIEAFQISEEGPKK